ncbi:MAG TPA: energy transducer TonB [Terracidiphilus sp.]|nr:energy transducer TonB [Terracidiphilus sp.]
MPQDPTALMTIAHEKNGLTGMDIKPWHMRGTYRVYDKKGKPEYEGTYEEWWVSPAKYKLSFTNPKSMQTDYATGTALFRDGSQEWLTGPEFLLRASLVEPLPDPAQLKGFTLQRRTQSFGRAKMECVWLTYPVGPKVTTSGEFFPCACFEPSLPILRVYSIGSSSRVIYDHLVTFQGHYLARQVQIFFSGKLAAEMNLDIVEGLKEPPDSIIAPPSGALQIDLSKITFKEASRGRWPELLRKALPVYPEEAKSTRTQGTVKIKAIIGPDGHVGNLQAIDGPGVLREPALDAVRQWIYRPFDVMGQPRAVEIEIRVIFSMG